MLTLKQAIKLGTLSHNSTFSPRDARQYGLDNLRQLVRAGLVERVARGRYTTTPAGEAMIRTLQDEREEDLRDAAEDLRCERALERWRGEE